MSINEKFAQASLQYSFNSIKPFIEQSDAILLQTQLQKVLEADSSQQLFEIIPFFSLTLQKLQEKINPAVYDTTQSLILKNFLYCRDAFVLAVNSSLLQETFSSQLPLYFTQQYQKFLAASRDANDPTPSMLFPPDHQSSIAGPLSRLNSMQQAAQKLALQFPDRPELQTLYREYLSQPIGPQAFAALLKLFNPKSSGRESLAIQELAAQFRSLKAFSKNASHFSTVVETDEKIKTAVETALNRVSKIVDWLDSQQQDLASLENFPALFKEYQTASSSSNRVQALRACLAHIEQEGSLQQRSDVGNLAKNWREEDATLYFQLAEDDKTQSLLTQPRALFEDPKFYRRLLSDMTFFSATAGKGWQSAAFLALAKAAPLMIEEKTLYLELAKTSQPVQKTWAFKMLSASAMQSAVQFMQEYLQELRQVFDKSTAMVVRFLNVVLTAVKAVLEQVGQTLQNGLRSVQSQITTPLLARFQSKFKQASQRGVFQQLKFLVMKDPIFYQKLQAAVEALTPSAPASILGNFVLNRATTRWLSAREKKLLLNFFRAMTGNVPSKLGPEYEFYRFQNQIKDLTRNKKEIWDSTWEKLGIGRFQLMDSRDKGENFSLTNGFELDITAVQESGGESAFSDIFRTSRAFLRFELTDFAGASQNNQGLQQTLDAIEVQSPAESWAFSLWKNMVSLYRPLLQANTRVIRNSIPEPSSAYALADWFIKRSEGVALSYEERNYLFDVILSCSLPSKNDLGTLVPFSLMMQQLQKGSELPGLWDKLNVAGLTCTWTNSAHEACILRWGQAEDQDIGAELLPQEVILSRDGFWSEDVQSPKFFQDENSRKAFEQQINKEKTNILPGTAAAALVEFLSEQAHKLALSSESQEKLMAVLQSIKRPFSAFASELRQLSAQKVWTQWGLEKLKIDWDKNSVQMAIKLFFQRKDAPSQETALVLTEKKLWKPYPALKAFFKKFLSNQKATPDNGAAVLPDIISNSLTNAAGVGENALAGNQALNMQDATSNDFLAASLPQPAVQAFDSMSLSSNSADDLASLSTEKSGSTADSFSLQSEKSIVEAPALPIKKTSALMKDLQKTIAQIPQRSPAHFFWAMITQQLGIKNFAEFKQFSAPELQSLTQLASFLTPVHEPLLGVDPMRHEMLKGYINLREIFSHHRREDLFWDRPGLADVIVRFSYIERTHTAQDPYFDIPFNRLMLEVGIAGSPDFFYLDSQFRHKQFSDPKALFEYLKLPIETPMAANRKSDIGIYATEADPVPLQANKRFLDVLWAQYQKQWFFEEKSSVLDAPKTLLKKAEKKIKGWLGNSSRPVDQTTVDPDFFMTVIPTGSPAFALAQQIVAGTKAAALTSEEQQKIMKFLAYLVPPAAIKNSYFREGINALSAQMVRTVPHDLWAKLGIERLSITEHTQTADGVPYYSMALESQNHPRQEFTFVRDAFWKVPASPALEDTASPRNSMPE